ncbi:hypothetical protein QQ056_03000 [Oscillatoria laete-virens NRMC-F 0139]|nr:hypothetical protein [Oscillatoria laete-virens]MDL5052530.1 hypothetical protein [Oscillatoria laete-virens NRMC-F 0139]
MAFSFFKKKSQPEEQNQETGPQIIVPPAAVPQSKKDASPASPTADLGKPSLNLPTQKAPPSPDTASLSKPALKSPLTPPPAPENKAVPPTPAAAIPPASATKKLPLPKINLGSAPAGLPPAPPKPNLPQAAPGDLSMARMPSPATPPTLGSAVPLVKKPAPPTPSPSAQQPAAPLPPPAPAVDHVDIPLTVIAKSIPEDMLNSSAATEGTYRFDAKKMIEQLSLGKVSLTIAEIAENAPQLLADPSQHHDQIINLPLGEIVKIAPKGLLQKKSRTNRGKNRG